MPWEEHAFLRLWKDPFVSAQDFTTKRAMCKWGFKKWSYECDCDWMEKMGRIRKEALFKEARRMHRKTQEQEGHASGKKAGCS